MASLQLPGVPDDPATLPPYVPPPNTLVLASILLEIGASDYLQKFIDEDQEDACIPSYKNPERISRNYFLPPSLVWPPNSVQNAALEQARYAQATSPPCPCHHPARRRSLAPLPRLLMQTAPCGR